MVSNDGKCGCGRRLGIGEFSCSFCSRDVFWEKPIPVDQYLDAPNLDEAWKALEKMFNEQQ